VTGREPHLRIHLQKKIPHGAGLGGGSSDAATTLLALNALFQTPLPRMELAELAAQLGSDVPVFIHERAAICRGRGEQVEPLAFPYRIPLLLVKPPFPVPTPWAYRQWLDAREIPGVSYTAQAFPWGELRNDLERPVFEKYLFLAVLKRWLLAQEEVAGALMSGSGSTVFAVLRDRVAAAPLAERAVGEFGHSLWLQPAETLPSDSFTAG
jgi:4-diphosphocytidyl-2-C-methyl-D-erythritol kinase